MKLSLSESTVVPELEPVEVPWAVLDVIIIPMVLEEEHLVTPEWAGSLRAGDKVTDESFFSTVLRGHIVSEDLKHYGVCRDKAKLIEEVVLVLVGPPVDVIGLNLNLEEDQSPA